MQKLKRADIRIFGTATTPEEAQTLEAIGVDAIVCQGQEAGGHRGGFSSDDPLYSLLPLLMLAKQRVKVPLIAAGGIMDGRSVKVALLAGAKAVQLGTAFITVSESGAHQTYKECLLKSEEPTKLTKAFTGKSARGIINDFMFKFGHCSLPQYPIQHFLTKKIRSLAAQCNRPDLMSLWAGQSYPLCQSISATELITQIAEDLTL
ncbi:MAG: nitronate monooxygenase [Chlamydiota bacterium]